MSSITSPCLLQGILLTNTVGEPFALVIPEQCPTSASPILVAAGVLMMVLTKEYTVPLHI